MVTKTTFADNSAMREIAMAILKNCGSDRDVILQVQRVMNSAEDTLPMDVAANRLEQLKARCMPSSKSRNLRLVSSTLVRAG
jgi:hypothetical protein